MLRAQRSKKVQLNKMASGKVVLKTALQTLIFGVLLRLGALTTILIPKVKQLELSRQGLLGSRRAALRQNWRPSIQHASAAKSRAYAGRTPDGACATQRRRAASVWNEEQASHGTGDAERQ